MPSVFDDRILREFSGFIAERMGLHFPEERWPVLAQSLKKAGRELGFEDTDALSRWLSAPDISAGQIETLATHLTIGETYLFRDPASFEILEHEILPPLVSHRARSERFLRLWSAGCCTGEEAYSLAITCARAVPDIGGWNISILATDINPLFLRKAEAGVYSKWSFRGTPAWVGERFFSRGAGGTFLIDPAIRRLVHFESLNMAVDTYPSFQNRTNSLDVIFCRNVLMYFTPELQRVVVESLHRCLVEGGLLVVNPAEASSALFPMFEMEVHNGTILYRKTSETRRARAGQSFIAPEPRYEIPAFETPCFVSQTVQNTAAAAPFDLLNESSGAFEPAARDIADIFLADARSPLAENATVEHEIAPDPFQLARECADRGQLDEALARCQQALLVERTNPAVYFLCGTIFRELGRYEESVDAFGKALYLDQDSILAHHALGVIFKQLGNPKESRRHLTIALKLLTARDREEVLPDSDGMTCGRLVETVLALKGA